MVEITLIIYFLFVLGIGFFSALKIKNAEDYYVGGNKAGILAVSGSLLATILGGSAILGTLELSQNMGWPAMWFILCASLGMFVLLAFAKRVKHFGHYTLPELIGFFYGKKAQIISSVIIPLAWTGIIAAQIIAAAKILSGLQIVSYQNAAIISTAVFIIYTVLGGQLSILKTDFLQSVLILSGLIVLLIFAINHPFSEKIQTLKISALFNSKFSIIDLIILMLSYSVTFVVGPDIYSRIFCAKNQKIAKQSVFIVAIALVPVAFIISYLGIFSMSLENNEILIFAEQLLPAWAYGIFVAALLSAVMSSADTTLLTSSMILADLFSGDLNKKQTFRITKILVIAVGILSGFVALYITSIIQALLFALTLFSGSFAVPVILALANIKINKHRILPAIILGGTCALAGKIIDTFTLWPIGNLMIMFAFALNFMVLIWPAKSN